MSDLGSEMWAWQAEEQPDVWTLIGAMLGDPETGQTTHTPMVTRRRDIAEGQMRVIAEVHATNTNLPIRLAHFRLCHVQSLNPPTTGDDDA